MKTGLDPLYDKGRINGRQKMAGERYGKDWRDSQSPKTHEAGRLPPGEARAHAALRLARARALALNGNAALADIADRICGEEAPIHRLSNGDRVLAGKMEDRIQRSLELLERYYFG